MKASITKPQRIISLSLNPSIDLTYEVHNLKNEEKSRATQTYFDPGGTGINVGLALEKLQANSHTCYISAGKTGEHLDALINQQLKQTSSLRVAGETRINTTILQQISPATIPNKCQQLLNHPCPARRNNRTIPNTLWKWHWHINWLTSSGNT